MSPQIPESKSFLGKYSNTLSGKEFRVSNLYSSTFLLSQPNFLFCILYVVGTEIRTVKKETTSPLTELHWYCPWCSHVIRRVALNPEPHMARHVFYPRSHLSNISIASLKYPCEIPICYQDGELCLENVYQEHAQCLECAVMKL